MTRVLIVAASPLARSGLENLLPRGRYDVVGRAASIEELEEILADAEAEVIVVDAGADPGAAILAAISASDIARELVVILLADHTPPRWSTEALRLGARAVLPADISSEQLQAAIEAALHGLLVIHPGEISAVAAAPVATAAENPTGLVEPLTRREHEVLQMLAAGLANKEIAAKLNLSDHTVKFHVAAILGKLGAGSRTEAVAIGIRSGLILF